MILPHTPDAVQQYSGFVKTLSSLLDSFEIGWLSGAPAVHLATRQAQVKLCPGGLKKTPR